MVGNACGCKADWVCTQHRNPQCRTAVQSVELSATVRQRDALIVERDKLKGQIGYAKSLAHDWEGIAELRTRERNDALQRVAWLERELARLKPKKRGI